MKRTFVYTDEKSSKFWTIEIDGDCFTVNYGKTGTNGQMQTKQFADETACLKEANKLITEKTKKGYVEESGAAGITAPSATTPPVFKREPAENPVQPISIACEARTVAISPLTDGGFCASDEKGNLYFFGPNGELRGKQCFTEAVFFHVVQNNNVYIYDKGDIVSFDYYGTIVKKTPGCNSTFNVLQDGKIIFKNDQSIFQTSENGAIETLKKFDFEISFRPLVTVEGDIIVVLRESPRVFVLLGSDGTEKWRTKLEGPNAWAPQKLTDAKFAVMSRTTINVVDIKNHKHITIPVNGQPTGWACPVGEDCIAYATDCGTVEIVSFDKKRKSSVRREAIGETNSLPIAGNSKEMIAPSKGKDVYRIAADGTCTGVCKLDRTIGPEKRHLAVLADGTFVVCDSGFYINILNPDNFGKGETPAGIKFLTKRAAELGKHFAPWAATSACKKIIKDVLDRLIAEHSEDDDLVLDFLSTEGETITVKFGAPSSGDIPEGFPESQGTAAALHSWVEYDNGDANGFYWCMEGSNSFEEYDDYDFVPDKNGLYNSNEGRYAELASAGQNWFMLDRGQTNKLGEPLIITFDHGGDFSDVRTFGGNSQKKTAYGIPGFIFRVIGCYVLPNDDRFDDCDMG